MDKWFPKILHDSKKKKMKIKKCHKLVCYLYNIENYGVQIRTFKHVLNHVLTLK